MGATAWAAVAAAIRLAGTNPRRLQRLDEYCIRKGYIYPARPRRLPLALGLKTSTHFKSGALVFRSAGATSVA